jgi:hypothetical protein
MTQKGWLIIILVLPYSRAHQLGCVSELTIAQADHMENTLTITA